MARKDVVAAGDQQMPKRSTPSQLDKWGQAGLAGFQLIPNVLFRAQTHLEIDSVDVVILLNLSLHWWGPSKLPFLSPSRIARRMGLSRRTVERRLESLERRGFVKRLPAEELKEGGAPVRMFEMDGFVKKLEGAAETVIALRDYFKGKRIASEEFL
jgi:DNA-binding transcriptional ArsR family regulator